MFYHLSDGMPNSCCRYLHHELISNSDNTSNDAADP